MEARFTSPITPHASSNDAGAAESGRGSNLLLRVLRMRFSLEPPAHASLHAVGAWADTELAAKGMVEIRNICKAGIKGDI
jgi:hypothetical protein